MTQYYHTNNHDIITLIPERPLKIDLDQCDTLSEKTRCSSSDSRKTRIEAMRIKKQAQKKSSFCELSENNNR